MDVHPELKRRAAFKNSPGTHRPHPADFQQFAGDFAGFASGRYSMEQTDWQA
jgi:hypothetical protein